MRKGAIVAALMLPLVLGLSSPGWARIVRMETAVALPDRSDAAIESALRGALDTCVRGAMAMGLSWIRLERAILGEDRLIVRMVGSDDEDEGDDVEDLDDDSPARPAAPAFNAL